MKLWVLKGMFWRTYYKIFTDRFVSHCVDLEWT